MNRLIKGKLKTHPLNPNIGHWTKTSYSIKADITFPLGLCRIRPWEMCLDNPLVGHSAFDELRFLVIIISRSRWSNMSLPTLFAANPRVFQETQLGNHYHCQHQTDSGKPCTLISSLNYLCQKRQLLHWWDWKLSWCFISFKGDGKSLSR